jgi:uncharacterized protein YicC (UPF0701 family)
MAACSDLMTVLNEERTREGGHIMNDFLGRLETIAANLSGIEAGWPAVIKAHEEKLRSKIAEITQSVAVDETRVLQRSPSTWNVRHIEEIVRLRGHLDNFRGNTSGVLNPWEET